MSVTPAAKNSSASFKVETVMPRAPAASCARAMSMHFVVFTWGRNFTPSAFMRSCINAMFLSIRARSMSAAGVSSESSVIGGLSGVMVPLVPVDKRMVGDRVPGVVDAEEKQQDGSSGDAKQGLPHVGESRDGGERQYHVRHQREHDVEQPILELRFVRGLHAHATSHDGRVDHSA